MPTAGSSTMSLVISYGLPFAVLILTWWFFIIRPQQKQEKTRREMLDSMKKGDQVVTIGGLLGTVSDIRKDSIVLKVDDRVEVRFLRTAIAEIRREKEKDRD